MPFQYISESNGMRLTQGQEDLLSSIEQAHYKFNISVLRLKKGYKVIVPDIVSFRKTLENEIKAYRKYGEEFYSAWLHKLVERSNSDLRPLISNANPIQITINKLEHILKRLSNQTILGLYRSFDFSYGSPTIYLFKENIDAYAVENGISSDNVFGFVYVHEVIHAYYDSLNVKGYHTVEELEEAFAECGMIDFLEHTCSALHSPLLATDARNSVSKKQIHGPYEYGFGLELAQISSLSKKTFDMMAKYRRISNRIYPFEHDVLNYQGAIPNLKQANPAFKKVAKDCYDLVEKILNINWPKPRIDLTSFPGLEHYMREAGVTLKPGAASPSISIAPASKLYLPDSVSQSSALVKLLASTSLDEIVQAIFKALGGNPEITDLLDCMEKKAKLKSDTSLTNINNLLKALLFWANITLAILDTDGHYVLYGPESLVNDFKPAPSKPSAKTTSTAPKVRTKYNLTDLQGNVSKNLSLVSLAVKGIKSYAVKYPSTIAELRKKFPRTLLGRWKSKGEIVMPYSQIPTNDTDYKKDLIPATNGPAVINRNWDRYNIDSLIFIFKSLGMTVTQSV